MSKLWTNFAKYRNPTPENYNPLDVTWKPTEKCDPKSNDLNLDYLVIDKHSEMKRNVNGDRMNFWRGIYKTWNMEFVRPKL